MSSLSAHGLKGPIIFKFYQKTSFVILTNIQGKIDYIFGNFGLVVI